MTFGFSKSPFFAHFQAILIFEIKKVNFWFHFGTFMELFITNSDIFSRFQASFNLEKVHIAKFLAIHS